MPHKTPTGPLATIAAKARRADSFQAVSALGHWPQSEPLNPQRIREVLERVRADKNLLAEIEVELSRLIG